MADVLVIGGGVVGLLAARLLQQRGLRVEVLAGGRCESPASWAGGGILSPLFPWRYSDALNALTLDALPRYQQLQADLQAAVGLDIEVQCSGLSMPQVSDVEVARRWLDKMGCRAEFFLGAGGDTAMVLPEVGQVRNPRLLKALRLWHQQRGTFHSEQVQSLCRRGPVWCVETDRGRWQAPQVLAAAGAWTPMLLRGLFELPGLRPVKGEMLLYPASVQAPEHIILTDKGYVIPRRDGSMLVGSTVADSGFDQRPTVAGYQTLKQLAVAVWPKLAGLMPVAHWAGLRPGFCRDEPVLMAVPEQEGLFVATGHFRNGLVAAPASAEFIACLMCGEPLPLPPEPYSLPSSPSSSSPPS